MTSELTRLRLHMLRGFSYEPIDELLRGVAKFAEAEHKQLIKKSKALLASPPKDVDEEWLQTFHDDDHHFIDEAKALSHELAVVALYKKVEIDSKRAIITAFPGTAEGNLFRIAQLKTTLLSKGVDITQFRYYRAMDETRCINNSIKHNGFVNSELAQFSGWTLKRPLDNLEKAYHRLAPLCGRYVAELVDALIAKHNAKKTKKAQKK